MAVFVSSQGTKTVAGLSSMGLIIGTLIPESYAGMEMNAVHVSSAAPISSLPT
ncbi:hypothetical protein ABZ412_20680 [Nocardia sp. NPDC005746]|uniref:hypothetical protein n=1 Tax=Nocardia sp. NPDC005746 TaxID=3157062 RepID=UPI0033CCF902